MFNQESWGAAGEGDSDEFKRILTDTDPWLLGITMVISILHSVFGMPRYYLVILWMIISALFILGTLVFR